MRDTDHIPKTAHHQLGRNVLFNWAGYAFSMGIGFVLAPLMVHRLGDTGYGIWAFSIQLSAYIAVLDFGVRTALTRYITHHHARGEMDQAHDALSGALTILGGVGIVSLAVTLILAHFLPVMVRVPAEMKSVAHWTLVLIGIQVSLAFPGTVFGGMLAALSRYDLLRATEVPMGLAKALLIWLVLARGYGLLGVAVVFLVIACGVYGLQFWLAWRIYGGFRFRLRRPQVKSTLMPLLQFGFFAALLGISGRIVLLSDNLVIGMVLGPALVTFYAIGGTLIDSLHSVLGTSISVVVPLAASLGARGEQEKLQLLFAQGSRFLLLLLLPAVVGFLVLGRPFILLWMGDRYAGIASQVLILLAIPLCLWPMRGTASQLLLGTNGHRFVAYIAPIEAVANLGLSIFLAYRMGVVGVAWGTLIPAVLIAGVVIPLFTLRRLGMNWRSFYWNCLFLPLLAGIPYAALLCLLRSAGATATWIGFLATVIGSLPLYFLFVWLFVLRRPEKEMVLNQVRLTLRPATS